MEKPYVLVVDDNEPTCTLIAALLQRQFELEMAGDGLEAIEKLRTRNYAAILLDLRLPQLEGAELGCAPPRAGSHCRGHENADQPRGAI